MTRTRWSERGQLLPIFVVLLVVIMGIATLAVDAGYWRYQQRLAQSAADSAAIAGADELNYAGADWSAAAKNAAAANGFADDAGVTVSVTPANPPTSGAYSGNAQAVQVVISEKQPALFGATLGFTSQWVSARAVAVVSATTRNCMYALGTSGNALTLNGSSVNTPNCGLSSNSGIKANGSTITAAFIGAAGAISANGSTFTAGQPATAVAQADPCPSVPGCAYLRANPPAAGTCLAPSSFHGSSSATIPAGRYCSLLDISGVKDVTFSPGVYRLDAGLKINGASTVSGAGVTFYNSAGGSGISINGSSVNLTAPASGSTAGVVIYQDPANTSSFSMGGSGGGLAGLLYFPTADVTLGGSLSKWLLVVASTVTVNGSGVSVPDAAFPGTAGHAVLAE